MGKRVRNLDVEPTINGNNVFPVDLNTYPEVRQVTLDQIKDYVSAYVGGTSGTNGAMGSAGSAGTSGKAYSTDVNLYWESGITTLYTPHLNLSHIDTFADNGIVLTIDNGLVYQVTGFTTGSGSSGTSGGFGSSGTSGFGSSGTSGSGSSGTSGSGSSGTSGSGSSGTSGSGSSGTSGSGSSGTSGSGSSGTSGLSYGSSGTSGGYGSSGTAGSSGVFSTDVNFYYISGTTTLYVPTLIITGTTNSGYFKPYSNYKSSDNSEGVTHTFEFTGKMDGTSGTVTVTFKNGILTNSTRI